MAIYGSRPHRSYEEYGCPALHQSYEKRAGRDIFMAPGVGDNEELHEVGGSLGTDNKMNWTQCVPRQRIAPPSPITQVERMLTSWQFRLDLSWNRPLVTHSYAIRPVFLTNEQY